METFIVSELGRIKRNRNVLRMKNLVERYETTQKYGWLKIDVTKTTMKWLLKPRLNHGMAVICKDCQQKNYKRIFSTKNETQPFLVITTRKAHNRGKRSHDNLCTDKSTECCLMPFTINFSDIGWDAIAYPQSIPVNYCRGSCHGNLFLFIAFWWLYWSLLIIICRWSSLHQQWPFAFRFYEKYRFSITFISPHEIVVLAIVLKHYFYCRGWKNLLNPDLVEEWMFSPMETWWNSGNMKWRKTACGNNSPLRVVKKLLI